MFKHDLRHPAVAGLFYPADPDELQNLVQTQLDEADGEPAPAYGAIAPHAGLVYSGQCAAHVFRRLAIPPITVLVGPNHRGRVGTERLAGTWARGAFLTPLGDLEVAKGFAEALLDICPVMAHDPVAHGGEHSLEVELPFLQLLNDTTRIVPIVLASDDWAFCKTIADALATVVRQTPEEVLLIASSDMTHYESASSAAHKDKHALAAVERLDAKGLLHVCRHEHVTMCGRAPAATVVEAARQLGASSAEVVDYRHSGWVTGDDSSVVAYAGVVIR